MGRGSLRNQRCFCGSGQKYKNCHELRERENPLERSEIFDAFRKSFSKKVCLHPDASSTTCSSKIINAHTVQRAGVLSRIAHDGHVYWFDSDVASIFKNNGTPPVESIGINRASTFTGFCARHDNELFRPLDDHTFSGSSEQCFLLAYRTLCHELYLKRSQIDALEFQKEFDRGADLDRQFHVRSTTFLQQTGALIGSRDFEEHKRLFDLDLRSGDFSNMRSAIIWLHDVPDMVCSGPVLLAYDFYGRPLQAELGIEERADFLSLSILTTATGGAAVFSWREDSGESAAKLVRSLLELPGRAVANAIVRLAFTSMGNLFMSMSWWDQLPGEVKEALKRRLVDSAHPAFETMPDVLLDDGLRPVTWRVAGIQTRM